MDTELNIFTKTKTSWGHTRLSLPRSLQHISSLLPFTCMTEWYENDNSARVPWTTLESANILFKRRRQGNFGSLLDQYQCIWEPLNIFIVVFSSVWLSKNRKINSEKHIEIFLEFLVFLEERKLKKGEKQKREKLFTREISQQAKEESRNIFGFSFNTTTE